MAALGSAKSLSKGERIKLNDSGPVTTTGTLDCSFVHTMNHPGDFSALFQCVGTTTGLVADLQFSLDGTTFQTYVSNFLVAATPFKLQALVDGALWRLNITTPPTSGDFYVVAN